MSWQVILTSAVISTLISGLFNWIIHKNNIKNERTNIRLTILKEAYKALNDLKLSYKEFYDGIDDGVYSSDSVFTAFNKIKEIFIRISPYIKAKTSIKFKNLVDETINKISGYYNDGEPGLPWEPISTKEINSLPDLKGKLMSILEQELRDCFYTK